MRFSASTIAAAVVFFPALVAAHVEFIEPPTVYKGNDGKNQFPLSPSGDDYPCTLVTGSVGEPPVYEPGSSQSVQLVGSAVHGGGSCQISLTYDNPPTKNSVFKVLKSFEGACPISAAGNLPDNPGNVLPPLPYEIPEDIPSGGAVLAWTWFNKIGNREMYMRCAPIKIGGSNTNTAGFTALPDMFKANIGNGCTTPDNTNIRFPNPGANKVGTGDADPVGTCGGSGGDGEIPTPTPPVLIDPPTSTTTAPEQPTPPPQEKPAPEKPKPKPEVPKPEVPEPSPKPTPKPEPSHPPPPPPSGGKCVDGTIICTSPTSWAICNWGAPVPMGATAAGTTCENGTIIKKRSIRFSPEHLRRRHH